MSKRTLLTCCELAALFGATCLDHSRPAKTPRAPKAKNLCAKTRPASAPYEIWCRGDWTWYVLKKWQADDDQPNARWFCKVITPMTGPHGDLGDCYVADIKRHATRTL